MVRAVIEALAELVALALFTATVLLAAALWIGVSNGIIR
jgi:hypothetical protein